MSIMGQVVRIKIKRRVRKVGNNEAKCPTCKGTGKVKK